MTLTEVRNQIFGLFIKNDSFTVPSDIQKIKVSKKQESFKEGLVFSILEDLVKNGFCTKVVSKSNDASPNTLYILNKPLGSEGQDVKISNITAELVAELINQYREAVNDTNGLVDKFNIKDHDIQNLCLICANLLDAQDSDPEDMDDDSEEDDE